MQIDDATFIGVVAASAATVSGFFAWQLRYMMCEMKESIDRNTACGEKILILLETMRKK